MKKIALIIAFAMSFGLLSAQNSKVQSALNYIKPQYNQLDKAKEAIDLACGHEKTQNNAKTWYVRGQVYQAIAQTQDEKFKTLSENPAQEALDAYLKALNLDVKKQVTKEINNQLKLMGLVFINKGIEYFNASTFEKAMVAFENSLRIDTIVEPGRIDTMVIFNAGIAADRAKIYDKAVYYYLATAKTGYEGAKVYGYIANIEKERGDSVAYVNILKDGITQYPEDVNIIFELINYYLGSQQSDMALEYISKAIEKDNKNQTLYFAQGSIYDKKKMFDEAKSSYEKAVEINPEYFDAYYNLGALFFNKGADLLKIANDIPPKEQKRYEEAVKVAFKELENALPYLEKAHKIDPNEKSTLLTLKEICFKLRNDSDAYMEKYKEYNEKVKNLPAE